MEYDVIFSSGYEDDLESLTRKIRSDVLLLHNNNYYQLHFITIERIKSEFTASETCYLQESMIILHEVTKENILKSLPHLFEWQFYKCWLPLTEEQIVKYHYPKEDWIIHKINI